MKMEKEQIPISTKKKIGDVIVVGAGVSGIQASLDLADSGFKVYLIDKAPSIGGKMAQLDKTFPTNDCSMCILSPKFIECDRHPNIEILTYTDIEKVEGEVGNFKITLIKKPRYVIEDECKGCGTCARYCPVKIPDAYNQELSFHKCIYIPFAQAVPRVSTIDPNACPFFQRKCKICVPVCKNKAIDFSQKEEKIEVEVGAIIIAIGYEIFNPQLRGDFGYGKIKNVVTSLEFERILSATGPYQGKMVCPDGKVPKKIAWIQCVGSRDVTVGNGYCSAVCCMYATKQAILAKERDSEVEATIFYKDIRAFSKGFEQFYQRAKSLDVRYVRSLVSIERQLTESGNVTIRYCPNESEVKEESFDFVVLSVGMTPPSSVEEVADKFSIKLNQYRFCQTNNPNPIESSRPGIFVCGTFQGPKDIPESVTSGSAAAALCGELLSDRRGKLVEKKVYPPERDVSGEKPRIGVFVCHCGTNIAEVVDVPSLTQYASTLSNVIHVEDNLFSCSADAVEHISETIKEKGLNRVIVAACTPRTHEPVFQEALSEAGINKYLFDMANIREHCSWVHFYDKESATQKAKDIVRMSVARVINLYPLEEAELPVVKKGLVIGGGIAGMVSALSLANQGFEVHLVEKNMNLGGMARRIHYTLEDLDVQAYLDNLIRRVYQHPLIHVDTNSKIIETSGYVGNFTSKMMSKGDVKEIRHGITIIATGADEYKPTEYLHGKDERVLTLLELEERIAKGDAKIVNAQNLVIILCVSSIQGGMPYCSRVCCSQAIKCALKLKEINPRMNIYIIHRDMRTYGLKEDFYREAATLGVRFIRYDLEDKPRMEVVNDNDQNTLSITVTDHILGKRLCISTDILALGVPVVPSAANKEISQLFKVPLNPDGFFLEVHMKLRPVDFANAGFFLCGLAHYPKSVSETIIQAFAVASRAATILSKDIMRVTGIVCEVNESDCRGCGTCESLCPYKAIRMQQTATGLKAVVMAAACAGCGICVPRCPQGALSLNHFTDSQIFSQIAAAFQRKIID